MNWKMRINFHFSLAVCPKSVRIWATFGWTAQLDFLSDLIPSKNPCWFHPYQYFAPPITLSLELPLFEHRRTNWKPRQTWVILWQSVTVINIANSYTVSLYFLIMPACAKRLSKVCLALAAPFPSPLLQNAAAHPHHILTGGMIKMASFRPHLDSDSAVTPCWW